MSTPGPAPHMRSASTMLSIRHIDRANRLMWSLPEENIIRRALKDESTLEMLHENDVSIM